MGPNKADLHANELLEARSEMLKLPAQHRRPEGERDIQ